MTVQHNLASLLDSHMKKASIGDARLAKQVNSITDNPYFIHRSTLRNWRTGSSLKVNNWRQLVTVAIVLKLDEVDANKLLDSGGCPSIQALRSTTQEADHALLAYWPEYVTQSTGLRSESDNVENNTASLPVIDEHEIGKRNYIAQIVRKCKLVGSGKFVIAGVLLFFGILLVSHFQSPSDSALNTPKNLLINSTFEDGILGWITYVNDAAVGSFKVDNEALHIQIDKTAERGWHISFNQKDLEVTAGQTYTARFRVRGDKATSVEVDLTRVKGPKTTLSFDNSVRQKSIITDYWTVKTIEFEVIETISLKEGGARLFFKFGKSNRGRIVLDDIEFFEGKIETDALDLSP